MKMKLRNLVLILVLAIGVLAGCGGTTPAATPQPEDTETGAGSEDNTDTTAQLDTSYEGALSPANQLALGTFLLEETADAVTPQQAKVVLPLWQAIQGGILQGNAEIEAVLGQIDRAMTSEQVAAIAARALTNEDLQVWAQEAGMDLGPSPEALAARQGEGGAVGGFADVSEEDRAARRATAEASGVGGLGQGGDMSAEDREARQATAEASGAGFGGRGGAGQLTLLAGPLIELLTERAAG